MKNSLQELKRQSQFTKIERGHSQRIFGGNPWGPGVGCSKALKTCHADTGSYGVQLFAGLGKDHGACATICTLGSCCMLCLGGEKVCW